MTMVLVKHAMPNIDPAVPASQWSLSERGHLAADSLARQLVDIGLDLEFVESSTEPKALATAAIMANRLGVEDVKASSGLIEHRRDTVGFLKRDEFEDGIAELFRQPDSLVFGSETANQSLDRFSEAIAAVCPAAPDRLIVTHGTVITLYVSRLLGLDPLAFWRTLELPIAVVLGGGTYSLVGAREQ